MKSKLYTKYFFTLIVALSLFSFLYVNLHAAYSNQAARDEQLNAQQPVMMEDENDQKRDIPVPDITTISRVYDIVLKFTHSNH